MAKILVIDDNPQIRSLLRIILEEAEYEVFEAINGTEGLKLYRKILTDLVVTDLHMPADGGLKPLIELRQQFPDVNIITITGALGLDSEEIEKIKPFCEFDKPMNMKEFLSAVSDVLN